MSKLDLTSLVKETLSIQNKNYIETIEKATDLLRNEKGRIGNITITNHLIQLDPSGEALVVGDLHGDLKSLLTILQDSRFVEKLEQSKDQTIIFLGDYGDRGANSAEVYYLMLKLKLAFPEQIIFLRGNHEAPKNLLGYPHDLPSEFHIRFGDDWEVAYQKTRALWDYLYNGVYVEERYLMVHGGVSPQIRRLQDIAKAQCDQSDVLEDCFGATQPKPRKAFFLLREVQDNFLAKKSRKKFFRK